MKVINRIRTAASILLLFAPSLNAQDFIIGQATQESVSYYPTYLNVPILSPDYLTTPKVEPGYMLATTRFKNFSLDQTTAENETFNGYLVSQGGLIGPRGMDTKLGNQDSTIDTTLTAQGKTYRLICLFDGSDGQGIGDLATFGFKQRFPEILQSQLVSQLVNEIDPQKALENSLLDIHKKWITLDASITPIDVSADSDRFAGATSVGLTAGNLPRGGILALLLDGDTAYIGGVTDSEIMIARNNAPIQPIGHAAQDEWIGAVQLATVTPQVTTETINSITDSFILLMSDGVKKALKKQLEKDPNITLIDGEVSDTDFYAKAYTLITQAITQVLGAPTGKPQTAQEANAIAEAFLALVIENYNDYYYKNKMKKGAKTGFQDTDSEGNPLYKRDDITVIFVFPVPPQ